MCEVTVINGAGNTCHHVSPSLWLQLHLNWGEMGRCVLPVAFCKSLWRGIMYHLCIFSMIENIYIYKHIAECCCKVLMQNKYFVLRFELFVSFAVIRNVPVHLYPPHPSLTSTPHHDKNTMTKTINCRCGQQFYVFSAYENLTNLFHGC